ncbi:Bug family tripartite tricarboxylate transporter substrate binding protein [Caenimonas aquaedulcis]|uniref:Tripartite tricarboxylate transporter substrate binding protein n=1 Tax=Caenimonas aquaedulcis TaxID=2793270 RepID=A0A931MIW6_9BURK|nr:tripartite tricarboxylate transporter substrate binding protein [Caenimonas aquaedulcis]MBG9390452.1 tripartite tricarboxylate transporter substrate binding protein [Caenimonas aquaedulcis]
MKRKFLRSLAALAATAVAAPLAFAQAGYPDHPIRVIVPFPPGGSVDPIMRIVGPRLGEVLGQPLVIDNRAGANSAIGAGAVAKAPADGYTLLFTAGSTHVILPLQPPQSPDFLKDFAPIAGVARSSYMLAVHNSVPAKTLPEFIAYAKANPGKLNFASSGVGNLNHLAAELFNLRAGTKIVHVPYKGGAPAVQDLVAGRVQMMLTNVPTLQPQVDAGALRALAYTTARAGGPPVPLFAQYGLAELEGIEPYLVLLAPARTPDAVIAKLTAAMQKVLAMPDVIKSIETQLQAPYYLPAQQLGERLQADSARMKEVIDKGRIVLAP